MSPAIASGHDEPALSTTAAFRRGGVVGVDVSLTCIGVAVLTAGRMYATTVISAGKRADTLADRSSRIDRLARAVLERCEFADLAVVEGLVAAKANGASIPDRHHLWWSIVGGLIRREVPVATIAPASLKLAIAGKGNADKAAVAIAVERLWPGMDVSSSDVSDAAGLAHLGAVHLGWDVPTLERHRTVKAAWPDLPDPTAKGAA